MNPPWSMILFTILAGAAQGLLLALVGADGAARLGLLPAPSDAMRLAGVALVLVCTGGGLAAATLHLGHPLRAWRAAAMWRTSWLSREVIVLPLFMAAVGAYGVASARGAPSLGWGLLAAALALVLYLCTGMIYGAVKAIRAWATPMTPLNYALMGIASGGLAACALAAWQAPALAPALATGALGATLAAALGRGSTMLRNRRPHAGTGLQSAIGVRHPRIVVKADGAMGGTFNTREFFHGRSGALVQRARWTAGVLAFAVPAAGLVAVAPSVGVLALLCGAQLAGLLAERWLFFAEAQHPQNLYHGTPRPRTSR